MRHPWRWLSVLAVAALVVGLAVAASSSTDRSPGAGGALAVSTSAHDDPSTVVGQMVALHQQMTEQMRVSDSPGMLQMMDADPMWAQMRTTAFVQLQDEHQREINRMLGLG
jgi:hypothetical protein